MESIFKKVHVFTIKDMKSAEKYSDIIFGHDETKFLSLYKDRGKNAKESKRSNSF